METITTKSNEKEEISTIEVKPVISEELKNKFKEGVSPDEISDATVEERAKMKESIEEKAIKEKTLKDKILSFFKIKTISEMTDPKKIWETANQDILDLSHISFKNTGIGFTMNEGGTYKDAIIKYELGKEGINLVKEWKELVNKIDKSKDNDERVSLQRLVIDKRLSFSNMIEEKVNKKIAELNR